MSKRNILLLVLAFVMVGGPAWGDRIARLLQILETDSSYKVRLQVCVTLGNLKDKRALPALIRVMGADENFTVRGVAAGALGQIGDKRALPELQKAQKKESDAFVKSQIEKAIKVLSSGGRGVEPPAGARFYITVGKLTSKATKGGPTLPKVLGDALIKEFGKVTGVVTDWAGRTPSGAELTKRRVKGFVLDGAILTLTAKRSGDNVEISCNIKVSLATFPGNSMKAFYTGGASTEVSARSFKPEYEDGLYKDVLEGAAQGAREHIAQSYLSTQ